jgi:nitroreductase
MELREAVERRRSIRRFSSEPVTLKEMRTLVDSAVMAPSSLNAQPWEFTIVTGKTRDDVVETVAKSTIYLADILQTFDAESRARAESFVCDLGGAPVIIIVSTPREVEEYERLTELVAVGGAIQNLLLTAFDMGLGACNITFAFWVRDQLAQQLQISGDIVSIIVVGHPTETPDVPTRNRDVARFIGFEGS